MKISSREEAVKHFMKTKQLEKVGLRAKASFTSHHLTHGSYFAITIEPKVFYVHEDGKITNKLPW